MRLFSIFFLTYILFGGVERTEAATSFENSLFHAKLGKGLSFKTGNKNYKVNLGGILQADSILHNSDKALLTDETGIRRGRLALKMQLFRHWDLRAGYNFTADKLNAQGIQNLYLRYSGINKTHFKVGNIKELIGLEWQTSSRHSTFMERALLTSLIPPFHLGFAASTHGKSWSAAAGIFGDRLTDGIHKDNGWGMSSRLTYAPLQKKKSTLHLGISGAYREPGEQISNSITGLQQEFNVENVRFSSVAPAQDFNEIAGAELAALRGPLSLQFEYLRTFTNQNPVIESPEFESWYIYGSWFLSGESRKYNAKSGTFGRIKPKQKFNFSSGGLGAWEIAARYSELNLLGQKILGGRESNITLGVNWYLNRYTRLMANYILVETDLNLTRRDSQEKDKANIFAMRVQIQF